MPKKDFERPDFLSWLNARLAIYANKKLFGEQRDPRDDDEKEELADLLRSLLARCKILHYVPTAKQQLFHDSRTAQMRGLFAPNQRGKTVAGAAECLAVGFGIEPWSGKLIEKVGKSKWRPRMRGFIGAKDFAVGHNEVIIPKLEELIPLEEIGCEFVKMSGRITHKIRFPEPFSFTLKFISYEQEPGKTEGTTWNFGWWDEPPPRHLYVTCRRGMLRHAALGWFTGTPLNEPWMYEEVYRSKESLHVAAPSDVKRLKWSHKAIIQIGPTEYPPGITKEQIDAWAETLDEEEKAARINGEFMHLQGRVYKNFNSTVRSKENPAGTLLDPSEFFFRHPNWQTYPAFCVVDPHDRKPFAFSWGIVTPRDEKVFISEWPDEFDFDRQKSWRWTIGDYARMIDQREAALWGSTRPSSIVWRIMDPNFGRTPKAGENETVEDMFAAHGLFFDTSVDDDVPNGHIAVRKEMAEDRLFVLSHLKNLIKGMENYVWDEYSGSKDRSVKERPRDKFKDFPDTVRYAVMFPCNYLEPSLLTQKNPWAGNGLG